MKNLIKISKMIVFGLFLIAIAFGTSASANASIININPNTLVGFWFPFSELNNSGGNSDEYVEAAILKYAHEGVDVNLVYAAVPSDGSEHFVTWLFDTSFDSASETSEATITPMGPSNLYSGDELWLLVKDGNEGHYLFDLFNLTNVEGVSNPYRWNYTDTLQLSDFYPGNGSISHIAFYSSIPANQVPEPSTMILLGFGLVGLTLFGRKRIKN